PGVSGNEEGLALILHTAQSADDFLHAEVVASTDTRREGVESRHLAAAQPRLFGPGSQPEGAVERHVGGAGTIEREDLCDAGKGSALVAQQKSLLVAVHVPAHISLTSVHELSVAIVGERPDTDSSTWRHPRSSRAVGFCLGAARA